MQDSSDTNLVMTDEEISNGYSPRSDQRTLSNQVSPKTDSKFLNTQELLSPIAEQRETLPTYGESDRYNEVGEDRYGAKAGESSATSRSAQYNPGKEYDEVANSTDESNMNNIKKLINEARSAERDYEGNENSKAGQHLRKQGAQQDKLSSTQPDRFQKGGDQKYEIDVDQAENDDEYQHIREVHSTKNVSSTPGQMRLSKMSEEDAATVFESRKREILSTLLKKGAKGKKIITQSLAGERPRGNSQEKHGEFIIYNQKNSATPQPTSNAQPVKKDDIVNKLLEKERDPSQSARKVFLDGSGNKNKFMTPKVSKTQIGRTLPDTPNDNQREENKIVVDLKKSNSKASQASGRKTPQADKQYTKNTVSSKNKEFNNINFTTSPPVRGVSPSHTNQTSRRTPFNENPSISSPKYEIQRDEQQYQAENNIRSKNREIMNEINDLDYEIQKLAQESIGPDSESESYKNTQNRQRATNLTSESGRKTPPAMRSVYSNFKPGRKTETNNDTPSIHSEDNRSNNKKRTQSDLPSEIHSNHPQMPNIKDQLNQSYSSLGNRKFSHHHEYLYERGMIQKIAQNDISIRTQRFKEQENLRECTFSPDIGSSSQRQNEDIVAKTRKWQAEKERQMVIQERAKITREMAECTFSPNRSNEKMNIKFPEKYYEKSVEWQKKVEENRQKKQEELYNSIMSNPEKSRNTSFNLSRMTDPNRTGLKSTGSNSNKQILTKQSSETVSSPKSNSSPKSGYYVPRQARGGEFKLKTKSVNEADQANNSQVQSQIAESYALLDGLQQFVNIKKELNDKIGKPSTPKPEPSEKENSNRAFIKGVATNPTYNTNQVNGSYRSLSKNKAPVKAEPTQAPVEQPQQQIPIVTLEGYDKNYISQNVAKLVVKNNRYVVDDSNISGQSVEDQYGRFNTKDSMNRNKREPSPKPASPRKDKAANNRYETIAKTNLGTNGLTSPTTQTLENKYFDLLGKVNKVTKQLSQVKAENKNLQKDINSIQNNNIKNSLYS